MMEDIKVALEAYEQIPRGQITLIGHAPQHIPYLSIELAGHRGHLDGPALRKLIRQAVPRVFPRSKITSIAPKKPRKAKK